MNVIDLSAGLCYGFLSSLAQDDWDGSCYQEWSVDYNECHVKLDVSRYSGSVNGQNTEWSETEVTIEDGDALYRSVFVDVSENDRVFSEIHNRILLEIRKVKK